MQLTSEGVNDLTIQLSDGSTPIEIDLAGATNLGDVIDKINEAAPDKLSAKIAADGNGLVIEDLLNAGGTFSIESDVGAAAEGLGIVGSLSGGTEIAGSRLIAGLQGTLVSTLKGGSGLESLGKIDLTDRNSETPVVVDLSSAETLDDIINLINGSAADITASINKAHSGIVLTDTSGGSGNLIVADNEDDGSETATALGLVVDQAQNSVDGGSLDRQTLGRATLLSSLSDDSASKVGDIRITDSNGIEAVFDFNATDNEAKNIGEVIDAINAKNDADELGVRASINETGDGILLTDTVLGEETLVVEDVNGTLAEDLKLTRASEVVNINGVDTQVIDGTTSYSVDLSELESTEGTATLASLKDGEGVTLSDIRVTDTAGNELSLDLNGRFSDITTVDEFIEVFNAEAENAGVQVTAKVNDSGTGLEITDTADGDGKLKIEDINGSFASDLKILSTDFTADKITGFGVFESQDESKGALESVAASINKLDSGVTASVLNDGVGYRLQLIVNETGSANEILLDASGSGFEFRETSEAKDALLVVGAGAGVLVSSSTNDFDQVVNDVDLTITEVSETAVDISVTESDKEIIDLVNSFIKSYNSLRKDLGDLTDFDEESNTTGLLLGTSEALRVDSELSRLITDRHLGLGKFKSLQDIGISVDDKGNLSLETSKLKEAFADDPQSLQSFFTTKDRGIVAKFNESIERLAGDENGILTNRDKTLQITIDNNQARIERFNEGLERKRERLLLQFYQLEQVISGLQTNQKTLDAFTPIPPQSIGS